MKIRIVHCGVALAAFLLSLPAAKAAPVTLSCGPTSTNRVGEGFVHFDESAGTAGWATTAEDHRGDSQAAFSDTEIRWKFDYKPTPESETSQLTYVLSRTTGELDRNLYNPGYRYGNGDQTTWCALVTKAF